MNRNTGASRSGEHNRATFTVEALEPRCLLASSLVAGTLTIEGTKKANRIDVSLNQATGRIVVLIDGANTDPANPDGYPATDVLGIAIAGLQGNDDIRVAATIDKPASISGDQGNDTISAGAGDDTVLGSVGNDSISGGAGDDVIDGGNGKDSLAGGDDDDFLAGGTGKDRVAGDAGDDALVGGTGSDLIDGGADDDILVAGTGKNTLTGGAGADLFSPAERRGVRSDFTPGTDFDAGSPVTVGPFDDPALAGSRTDLVSGAPDVNDRHHDNALNDSFYPSNGFSNPPAYGPHHSHGGLHSFGPSVPGHPDGAPVQPTGVFASPLPDLDVIHNLEHGHVWISYDPALVNDVALSQLQTVFAAFGARSGIVLSPRPANDDVIALVSWAHLATMNSFDLGDVVDFILTNRGHAPEGFITP